MRSPIGTLSTFQQKCCRQLVERVGIDGGEVDDVIFGCTTQVGAQACNIARRAVLAAGWPERVPGATVDRHAASSAQAVHWAAQAVMSGAQDLVVAGGVEVMTAVPLGASLSVPSVGKPYGQRLQDRYKAASGTAGLVPPGLAAEEVARRWSLDRSELDKWALQSRERAFRAQRKRPSYMLALPGRAKTVLAMDEALGRRSSRADLAALSPVYLEGGVVTAANMAAEGDGASGLLIAGADRARRTRVDADSATRVLRHGWHRPACLADGDRRRRPRKHLTVQVLPPTTSTGGRCTRAARVAVHVWLAEMKVSADKVNPTGGALASTAPLGAVGAGLFVTAISGLVEAGLRRALVCVAAEGGIGTACVLERA